jgi:hypothetical protein
MAASQADFCTIAIVLVGIEEFANGFGGSPDD